MRHAINRERDRAAVPPGVCAVAYSAAADIVDNAGDYPPAGGGGGGALLGI